MTGTSDLRRVRFFVELARDLHFGRSAERQHVSQPTLSQQIKRLETELGVSLFVRPAGTVTLTPAGERLLPVAEELLGQAERFNALAAGLAHQAAAAEAPTEQRRGGSLRMTAARQARRRAAGVAYAAMPGGNQDHRARTAGG